MRIFIAGADGFIGSAVAREIESSGHEVLRGRDTNNDIVDLLDEDAVKKYLQDNYPEVIINCAGVVDPNGDFSDNVRFTRNIIVGASLAGLALKRVIISGSAGEYGIVRALPVSEDTTLLGNSPYALSKIEEEQTALQLAQEHKIPVTIARVFNPIGPGMKGRFLVPNLWGQIQAIEKGRDDHIEISRLDAKRDYISVYDIATAYRCIAEGTPSREVYNIGTGISTSNEELLNLLLENSKLKVRPKIIETLESPEPQIASQADISRISKEFQWQPKHSLKETIRRILEV